MRMIALFILILTLVVGAQTKYFLPFSVQQSNGRPINNANVDLYTAGTATKVYDLTYQDNSPGLYYNTVAFADGIYDLYVSGVAVMTRISLGGTVSTADVSGIVTDSLNTFAGVNGIVFNTTLNDIGQKIVKDTTTLKAYSGDSLGVTVYLKQLSSANTRAGGVFALMDSAAMRTLYGAGIVGNVVSFKSGTAGRRWFRDELIRYNILRPEWFGAVMDGITDDYAAIEDVIDLSFSLQMEVVLGRGTYKSNTALDITNPASTSANNFGIRMIGQVGANKITKILFASGCSPAVVLDGSTIAGTRVYNIYLENILFESAATDADTGFYINDATTATFKDVSFNNWKLGVLVVDSDNIYGEHFSASGGDYGMHLSTNANGNTFVECAFTGNDSVGIRFTSNYGNIFVGGDRGNQPISFEGVTTAVFDVYGGNFESHDSAAFVLNTNTTANIHGSRFLEGSPSGVIGYLHNTTNMNLYGIAFSGWAATDSTFIMDNSTCRVLGYGINENQNIYVWNATTSVKDVIGALAWVRTAAISGLDRSKLYYATGNRTTETDQLVMLGNVKGTDHVYYLFDGEERYDLNTTPGTAPVRKPQVIHVEGYEQFVSIAGDSTEVTVSVHDSTAVTFYYIAPPGIRKRSGSTITDMYGTIKSYDNTYGTITFLIWHKANANLSYDPTAGSLELEIQYRASFATDNGW